MIELRRDGHSFASIAKDLGLARTTDAFNALVGILPKKSQKEQRELRAQENGRLDALEKRTRLQAPPDQLDRKLAAIGRLRKRLAEA